MLDEPSIGLHQRDNDRLIDTLKSMRDLGNTLIVVEHDEDTMMACDYLIDIGPGAGIHGGEFIEIKGAKENNLKNINLKIPMGILNVVTGVSGSGKINAY